MSILLEEPVRLSGGASLLLSLLAQVEGSPDPRSPQAGPVRAECLAAIAAIPDGRKDTATIAAANRLVEAVIRAGWTDQPAAADLVAEANRLAGEGWRGILAALLLAPAWQIAALPTFDQAPLFLWRTLAAATFRLPAALTALGQADRLATAQRVRLQELAALARNNPGSAAVRDAAAACLMATDCLVLASAGWGMSAVQCGVEEILALRCAIRAALARGSALPLRPLPLPRVDRRLRVGAVVPELRNSRALRGVLPWIEFLDPSRFQVIVFCAGLAEPDWAEHLRGKEIEFRLLAGSPAEQAVQLGQEALDVALFATAAATGAGAVADLLATRAAPLQLTVDERGFRTGEAAADAALAIDFGSGSDLLPPAVMAVSVCGVRLMSAACRGVASRSWTRAALGFADDAVIFACAAPFALLSPEWAECAAQILAGVPTARLLIHSEDPLDAAADALLRVCATLEPALERHGIEAARCSISNEPLECPAEREALLRVADLYFHPFASGDDEGAQVALQAGLPILALRSQCGRATPVAATMLRLGLSEGLADTAAELTALAVALGRDHDRRSAWARRVPAALAEPAAYQDPIALGELTSAIIERAFDLLAAADGAAALPAEALTRMPPLPLPEGGWEEASILLESGLPDEALRRLTPWFATDSSHPVVRPLFYSALIQGGQPRRAAAGLAATVDRRPFDAEAWRLLARAELWLGRREDAAAALRKSLRLAPRQPETWSVLEELVQNGGHHALAEEVSRHRLALTAAPAAAAAQPLRKSLYFSPVGRAGKEFLARMVERFPADRFDFLVISYDDTDFSDLADRVEVVRDRGHKWRFVKKYLTPEKIAAYEYVFIWDDDLDPQNFEPITFVDILRRNRIDIAQPSLTQDSHSFHPITVAHDQAVGRLTNFVEIMCPVYSSAIWPSIYPYIEPEVNELGWGYDLIPLGRKAIVDCMSVRHTRPGQSGQAGAAQQYAAWAPRHGIQRPALKNLLSLS